MEKGEAKYRTVIVCTSCRNLYAAEEASDGTLYRIGGQNECSCGENDFVEVDSETVFDGD